MPPLFHFLQASAAGRCLAEVVAGAELVDFQVSSSISLKAAFRWLAAFALGVANVRVRAGSGH
jgi:hypothetical protein